MLLHSLNCAQTEQTAIFFFYFFNFSGAVAFNTHGETSKEHIVLRAPCLNVAKLLPKRLLSFTFKEVSVGVCACVRVCVCVCV